VNSAANSLVRPRSLAAFWRKYTAIAQTSYATTTAYLFNLLASALKPAIFIWIFVQLYGATYKASGLAEINGLSLAMVVWTLGLTQAFHMASRPLPAILIEEEVKSGSLAYSLIRPYSYALFHYFNFLGRAFPTLIANGLISVLVLLLLVGTIHLTIPGIVFGLVLLFFGYTMEFSISLIIGLMAFWIEDTSALRWIYSKGQLIFGGMIVPLALFPEKIRNIAELLPFSQFYYAPAQLMISFDIKLFERFALIQFFWLTVFSIISYLCYKKGIRHVAINGG